MNNPYEFALDLRDFFKLIPRNVWKDMMINDRDNRVWNEDNILRTSILQNTIDNNSVNTKLTSGGTFKLKSHFTDYGGNGEETITGADLAILYKIEINNVEISNKAILIQLKRSKTSSGRCVFESIHKTSGKRYYKRDVHQAEKMLYFTSHAYYWLASSKNLITDTEFFNDYIENTGIDTLILENQLDSVSLDADPLSIVNKLKFMELTSLSFADFVKKTAVPDLEVSYEDLSEEDFDEGGMHHTRGIRKSKRSEENVYTVYNGCFHLMKDALKYISYNDLRELKSILLSMSKSCVGMSEKLGVTVCHAENILKYHLYNGGSNIAMKDIYKETVPLVDFILTNIIGRDLGDDDQDFIDALANNRVRGFFQNRVEEVMDHQPYHDDPIVIPGDTNTVGGILELTLQVNSESSTDT